MTPKLTIGMAVYDDFDGVYFTVQSLRLLHQDVMGDVEFVVVDNHPDSPAGQATRQFIEGWIPDGRYVPFGDVQGTAAPRDRIFREARGDAVLCIDSHVLLASKAVRRLIGYYVEHPDCRDLLQGPMLNDDCRSVHATHMDPVWRSEMFGIWAKDTRGEDPNSSPFEIPMHGLGLFSCRRDAWLGFNEKFRGFGGEEGYIHEKYRRAGARTICLPFLRWLHRFSRPTPVAYALTRDDKLRNYLIAAQELGLDPQPALDHFRPLLPAGKAEELFREVTAMSAVKVPVPGMVAHAKSATTPTEIPRAGKVSCLMATHGRWSKVCEALACFLSQDYPFKELVILNNHPQPLRFDHPEVRILNEPRYPNLGACRNRLIDFVNGEFVRTWDDDDLYLPWAISQGVAHIGSAPAFKPRRSWLWEGREGGFRLCENVMEASWTVRADVVRKHRYQEGGGDEHNSLGRGIELEGGIRLRDFGPFSSYVYRWGHGMHHISGTLGRADGLEARTAEWVSANQDTGNGRPLEPADLSAYWQRLSYFCESWPQEIESRALRRPPPHSIACAPEEQIRKSIDVCLQNRANLVAVSLGRIGGDENIRRANRVASARQLAGDPRIRKAYFLDTDHGAADVMRQAMPSGELVKVKFLEDAQRTQIVEPLDLVLIDAGNDPLPNLECFQGIKEKLSDIAVVVVAGFRAGAKTVLIRAALEPTHIALVIGDLLVFQPRPLPDYLRWSLYLQWK